MINRLKKPWLFFPPELSHSLSPLFLNLMHGLQAKKNLAYHWNEIEWEGLHFRNPMGTAGGLDKNGVNINAWWNLGAGFLEIGTVTPYPQTKNSGKTVGRDIKLEALWNCLGFPNYGADKLKTRLAKFPKLNRITPVFVNIGKNRWTENIDAHKDYIQLISEFKDHADALVINISSPNTKGLRDLFTENNFRSFLTPICEFALHHKAPPLILKLSPDLDLASLENIVTVTEDLPIKGWILANTTQWRSAEMNFETNKGGVSGKPLSFKSEKMLIDFQSLLGSRRSKSLIISTGGISSKADVQRRLSLGADLTQVYTALVFQGPSFFKNASRTAIMM